MFVGFGGLGWKALDGGFEFGDDGGGKFGAERHAGRFFAGDVGDDECERGAVFTAFVEGVDRVDAEAALGLRAAMATPAMLG